MTAPTNHWKLGLFVVSSGLAGLVVIGFLAGRALREDTVRYTSYFDEAVSGLNTGSSVSYRGVKIGNVSEINIAPDRRHVEVKYQLGVDELRRLGLATDRSGETTIRMPPDLRAQVGSSGVTGSKYLQIDFFDPHSHPPPKLPFDVPENYIPATSSTIKSLESAVSNAVEQIPQMARQLDTILTQANALMSELHDQQLPQRAAETLTNASAALVLLRTKLAQVPVEELSSDARGVLARADSTLQRADQLLAQMTSERGLVASVQRASDAVGDVAGNANYVVSDLGTTLRDLRETIDAVRQLADALERDSDMLVKGRARTNE